MEKYCRSVSEFGGFSDLALSDELISIFEATGRSLDFVVALARYYIARERYSNYLEGYTPSSIYSAEGFWLVLIDYLHDDEMIEKSCALINEVIPEGCTGLVNNRPTSKKYFDLLLDSLEKNGLVRSDFDCVCRSVNDFLHAFQIGDDVIDWFWFEVGPKYYNKQYETYQGLSLEKANLIFSVTKTLVSPGDYGILRACVLRHEECSEDLLFRMFLNDALLEEKLEEYWWPTPGMDWDSMGRCAKRGVYQYESDIARLLKFIIFEL